LQERGAYAAWQRIQQADPELTKDDDGKEKPEWTKLVQLSEWRDEAKEVNVGQLSQSRVATTPDGRWLAVIGDSADGSRLLLFDTSDLTQPAHSIALASKAERVAIAPNGRYVATISDDAGGQLSVVRVDNGAPLLGARVCSR
jgi:hypothetical protein